MLLILGGFGVLGFWGFGRLNRVLESGPGIHDDGNPTEDVPNTEVYNLQHPRLQEAEDNMVRKLVAETRQFDNLYFEIINEPYWHSVTPQWQRHITG